MSDPKEGTNGTPTPDTASTDVISPSSEVSVSPTGNSSNVRNRAAFSIQIAPAASTITSVIMSFGAVGCFMFFIDLCFKHPDQANIVVPLVMYPILRLLAKRFLPKKEDK